MNKVYFYVKTNDPEMNGDMWIVFATESEIKNDCIQGEALYSRGVGSHINTIDKYCEDDGAMCEDYLLHPTNNVTASQIKTLCKTCGFIEDSRLDGCGWG